MEEKRTIIAFVLIGLILVLMPYYYELTGVAPTSPPPIPEETERSSQPEREREPTSDLPQAHQGLLQSPNEEASGGVLTEREETVPASEGAAYVPRTVNVTTPLQELVFSSSGGSLVSARLLSFDREEGEPVELVPEGSKQLTARVRSETSDQELDLSTVEFAADSETVRLQSGQSGQLRMVADLGGGKKVEKTYRFNADQHAFDLTITCSGCTDQELLFIDWQQGINRAEKNHGVDLAGARVMAYVNESKEEFVGEDELQEFETRGNLKWAGVRNKYFLCAVVPRSDERHWVELSSKAGYVDSYGGGTDRSRGYDWPELNFSIGGRGSSLATIVYLGPLDLEQLEGFGLELERSMDLGFPVVKDIARVLLLVFVAAHEYVPNYGMLIILFALVVKILVYPLTHKSYESASKMQEIQPKVAALREKYKNDSQRLSKETMALYKEEGVNPIGGCLPLLLQMPIFIALYQVFSNTIELRHAPFVGWIDDLSVPDELMVMGFGLHVLPLLMSAAMFFQSKMTMKDPKQAMLVYMMPAVMIFIMWDFSSGLVLYWTVFNVLTIGQQYLTNHLRNAPEPVSVQPPPKKRSK